MAAKKAKSNDKAAKRSKKKAPSAGAAPTQAQDDVQPLEDAFIEIEMSDDADDAGDGVDLKKSGRRQARIPVAERVEVSGFFGVERAQRISDVSVGGVFVETPHVLEVGDPVVLAFPDRGSRIRVSGRVRWVSPFGGLRDARAGMGIELVGLSDAERMRIFELLRGKHER